MDDLAYKVRAYPLIPALALIMTVVALILILFDSSQRTTVFYMIPFMALCYVWYYVRAWWKKRGLEKKRV